MKNFFQLLNWMVLSIIVIFLLLMVFGLYIWPIFGLTITMYSFLVIAFIGLIELLMRRFR